MELTYLESRVLDVVRKNKSPLKLGQIGDTHVLRGALSSLKQKGLVTVSATGLIHEVHKGTPIFAKIPNYYDFLRVKKMLIKLDIPFTVAVFETHNEIMFTY